MDIDVKRYLYPHLNGGSVTHPIARLASRLAALLLFAGDYPAHRRALPADSPAAHSGAFYYRFQDFNEN